MAKLQPIIVKRRKAAGGDQHHGGAWKVAYADFVTAMMAFFLMMWLLNATTEQQKKGLADYFDSRIPISPVSGGGSSAFKGDSLTDAAAMAESGGGFSPTVEGRAATEGDVDNDGAGSAEAEAETRAFREIADSLADYAASGAASPEMMRHLQTRMTPEGLVVDLYATDGEPLFRPGSSTPTPMAEALLSVVAATAALVTNDVAIKGHAGDALDGPDGNWTLSFDQGEAARRMLAAGGLDAGRIVEVAGRADASPMLDDPADARNNRIEITFLRRFPTR